VFVLLNQPEIPDKERETLSARRDGSGREQREKVAAAHSVIVRLLQRNPHAPCGCASFVDRKDLQSGFAYVMSTSLELNAKSHCRPTYLAKIYSTWSVIFANQIK
jgi:hypothetical protein